MAVKRATLAGLLGGLLCLGAGTWLYDRHYFSVRWPAQVQREVLGTEIASANALISKERHFTQFAEGFARWRYKVEASNGAVQRLCGSTPVSKCSFTRTRRVKEGVALTVSLSGGVLTLEEWWS
jgi:hypothetical protein